MISLVNDKTLSQIDAVSKKLSSSIVIDSNNDIKQGIFLANQLSSKFVRNSITINTDKNSIGIDTIRELKKTLSLTANRSINISRFIIIEKAEKLTIESQNALLKIIEELPNSTVICLVVENTSNILHTILSRCSIIKVLPMPQNKAIKYASEHNIEESTAKKYYAISDGKVATYINLVKSEDENFDKNLDIAKKFISTNTYNRIQMIDEIISKNIDLTLFIDSIKLITKSGMRSAKALESKNMWKKKYIIISDTKDKLEKNSNKKLSVLSLSIQLE